MDYLEHLQSSGGIDSGSLIEGKDFYLEKGLMVFMADYHLNRGYCCGSGCRHCPFQATDGQT